MRVAVCDKTLYHLAQTHGWDIIDIDDLESLVDIYDGMGVSVKYKQVITQTPTKELKRFCDLHGIKIKVWN